MRTIRLGLAVLSVLIVAEAVSLGESAVTSGHGRRRRDVLPVSQRWEPLLGAHLTQGSDGSRQARRPRTRSRPEVDSSVGHEPTAVDEHEQSSTQRILLVDGPSPVSARTGILVDALRGSGYEVGLAPGASACLERLPEPPDLVLLATLKTGVPWTELCRKIRQRSDVPIVIGTRLDSELDAVLAFELGVSAYVTDESRTRELVARVRAALRPNFELPSVQNDGAGSTNGGAERYAAGALKVDLAGRDVRVNGRSVYLARREFDLLATLLSPPGLVRSRQELIDLVWKGRGREHSRTLDAHIRRLRLKLERDPAQPRHLVTVRGVGFRFDAEAGVNVI